MRIAGYQIDFSVNMKSTDVNIKDFKNITLFPGLNSLRFIAAFLVLMHHSETIKAKNGIDNFEWLGLFRNGGNAVVFFFVLSGFLITYLLMRERSKTGTISIRNFYLKRVLRIWPLYFLLVLIGTIALPFAFSVLKIDYDMPYTLSETWFYFVFFLPSLVTFFYGHHFLEPLWSIGVEEVFYLIWAPLIKFSRRNILVLLLGVVFVKAALSLLGIFVFTNELYNYLTLTFSFEAMAIGGLGAWFIYMKGDLINRHFIFKTPVQIFVFSLTVLYLLFHSNIDNEIWRLFFKTPIVSSWVVELLFLYIIICVSSVDHSVVRLRSRFLSYLGEISYGIYMYQMLVIFATIFFLKDTLLAMTFPFNQIVYYLVVFVLIIFVSAVSKVLFEDYFLKLKGKLK